MNTKPFPYILLAVTASAFNCDDDPTSLLQMGGVRAVREPRELALAVPDNVGVEAPWLPTPATFNASDAHMTASRVGGADFMPWEGHSSVSSAPVEEQNWLLVYALIILMFLAISPIVVYKGYLAVLLLACYLISLTLVKLLVKKAITLGFPYPDSITAIHMSVVCLVALCFERPRREEAWEVLPISLVSGVSLLANNTALLYGGVAFVSMVHANVPFFTFAYELFKGRRSINFRSSCAVLLVCAGSAFCLSGEETVVALSGLKSSSLPLAISFAVISSVFRSVRGVWQEELVCVSLTPMRLIFWNSVWSLIISGALMSCNEGLAAFRYLMVAPMEAKTALLGSTVAGVGLNITQVLAVKELGALMQSIAGNLNLILVIALSQAWLYEQVAPFQYFGALLLACGTFVQKAEPFDVSQMDMDQRLRDALRIIGASSPRSFSPVDITSDFCARNKTPKKARSATSSPVTGRG